MTSDQQVTPEPESLRASPVNGRPGTVSPTPRLPGYVPGMPRPMTPRDFDTDEQRSHSTTPRATSPTHLPGLVDRNVVSPTPFSSLSRRASEATAPRASPQPPSSPASTTSSMFLPRSIHGRLTPEGTNIFSAEAENFFPSSLLANRRRPISPLSGPAFKPLTLSQRPGTPSNVVWNVPNHGAQQKTAAHSRNGSLASEEVAVSNDGHNAYAPNVAENPKLSARSLHSPALPDSPVIDLNPNGAGTASTDDHHASSANTRVESGSSVMTNRLRSPTPTQGTAQSPSSPTFPGLHSSPNRNGHSPQNSTQSDNSNTPFAIPRSTLVFSPIANSSRSSLESAGSSYHSWDTSLHKEHTLFSDRQQSPWHDLSTSTDKTSPASSEDACDAEDIIGQYAGLTKNDFVAIQEKLVSAAMAKFISPPVRDRVPSLRRRRPSTSQSNYSLSGMDTKVSVTDPPQ
jgi:serine/arginine repetitive matrix protein 2